MMKHYEISLANDVFSIEQIVEILKSFNLSIENQIENGPCGGNPLFRIFGNPNDFLNFINEYVKPANSENDILEYQI